jgi:hypothetical protein
LAILSSHAIISHLSCPGCPIPSLLSLVLLV